MIGLLIILGIPGITAGLSVERYSGRALDKRGNLVYEERHQAYFSEKRRIQKATSRYYRPDGTLIGVLESDFSKLLTAPDYYYKDLRTSSEHGLRLEGDAFVLFRKDGNGQEESRVLKREQFDQAALVVGCQGLHYYLIQHMKEVEKRRKIPIKFLIPGDLDYYNFTLYYKGERDGLVDIEIKVANLFLRLFAPTLDVRYRRSDGRLLSYFGVSNIVADDGALQTVSIQYQYEP